MNADYKDEKWLREQLEVMDTKIKDIAADFGVSTTTISYFAKKYKIQRPGNTRNPKNLKNASLCHNKEWLHHQYITLNRSYDDISEEFGIGKTTVARYVKKYNLEKDEPPQFRGVYAGREKSMEVCCKHCGKPTRKKPAHLKRGGNNGKFCSQSCSTKWQAANTDLVERAKRGYQDFLATPTGARKHQENSIKGLRVAMSGKRTSIEVKMAEELTYRGVQFTEQYILGEKFALDFFLEEYGIVIECDGDYWHRRPEAVRRDKAKNAYIKACGYTLFRFWESDINADVGICVDTVMEKIEIIKEQSKTKASSI